MRLLVSLFSLAFWPIESAFLTHKVRHVANFSHDSIRQSICEVGDKVTALYAADGTYRAAIIQSINGDGTIEVEWLDKDPNHRIMYPSFVNKGALTCADMKGDDLWREQRNKTLQATHNLVASNVTADTAPADATFTAANPNHQGIVHFLFMVNGDLPHAKLWQKWLTNAAPGSWRAFVHCKDPAACNRTVLPSLPGFEMVETTPTWYCHDLVTAMTRLLSTALGKQDQLRGAMRQKFVFLSDSTLPAKPFNKVYQTLMDNDNSDFCIFPRNQWGTASIDGQDVYLVKHHQWVILNQAHAAEFVQQWVPVDSRGVWRIWLKSGHWQNNERYVSPQHFYHPPATNWCADEWAFLATVFGIVENRGASTDMQHFGGGKLILEGADSLVSQGVCRTFTYWNSYDGGEFTSLGKALHADTATSMSCFPKCLDRPTSFSRLGAASIHHLKDSGFLFFRKANPQVKLPDEYYKLIIQ